MPINLDELLLRQVREILNEYVPNCEVWAFGSRVGKHAKPCSDLDLAIVAPDAVGVRTLAILADAFEESDLPIRVDIVDWQSVNPAFRAQIAGRHEVIFRPV